jgi:hypothetical protein
MSYIFTGLFLFSWQLPGILGLPSAPGRFRPGLSANPFGLGDRKATHSRLGPAEFHRQALIS